jgi:hypothetical protein
MSDYSRIIELSEGRSLIVTLTEEGIIIDAYNEGDDPDPGTSGMTYEEWHESLTDAVEVAA